MSDTTILLDRRQASAAAQLVPEIAVQLLAVEQS